MDSDSLASHMKEKINFYELLLSSNSMITNLFMTLLQVPVRSYFPHIIFGISSIAMVFDAFKVVSSPRLHRSEVFLP